MSLTSLLNSFVEEHEVVIEEAKPKIKKKEGISLKGVLQRGRLKHIKERKPSRQGVTFSPSTLTWSFCRRLKVGQMAGLTDIYYDKPRPSDEIRMDLGNHIHEMFQDYFWDIKILKGTYKCLKCDKLYHDLISPESCPSGIASHKKSHMKYKEVIMASDKLPIRGRCDGILIIDGEEHIVDIKSIQNRTPKTNDRQFTFEDLETQGPKEAHKVQLMLYMWMSGIKRGHLLYFGINNCQQKTFEVKYDEDLIKPYLDEVEALFALAQNLKQGKRVELPAPCGRESCRCDEILGILPS